MKKNYKNENLNQLIQQKTSLLQKKLMKIIN